MEKVKLTKKQAEVLNAALQHQDKLSMVKELTKVLEEISLDTLIEALYTGYEVEPEFKEWDWVVYLTPCLEERVGMITDVFHDEEKFVINNYSYTRQKDHILRHANEIEVEEAEKAEWHNRGRDVWELRTGDILVDRFGSIIEIQSCHNGEVVYTFGEYKLTDKIENIKEEFYVAFFVEDRQLPIL